MKRLVAIIMVLSLMLAGSAALAAPIELTDGSVSLAATGVGDDTPVTLDLQSFHLIGVRPDGGYLIFADQGFYAVDADALAFVAAGMEHTSAGALGRTDALEPLSVGSKGEAVEQLQNALYELGYLDGKVDGDFGKGTDQAIRDFQQAVGLKQTGVADANLQLLVLSMLAETEHINAGEAPKAAYEAIADRVSIDMQPIYDSGLFFEYDDMTGEGFITDGAVTERDLSGAADIDKYRLTVRFGLWVREDDAGGVAVDPAVEVSCLCVRRPVLTEVILKSGSRRGSSPIENLTTTIDGLDSLEKGMALLSGDMVEALAGADEAGELKLRIAGRYNSFDLQLDGDAIASASRVGAVAKQIAR